MYEIYARAEPIAPVRELHTSSSVVIIVLYLQQAHSARARGEACECVCVLLTEILLSVGLGRAPVEVGDLEPGRCLIVALPGGGVTA